MLRLSMKNKDSGGPALSPNDKLVVYPRTKPGSITRGWRGATMSGLFNYLDKAEKTPEIAVIKILNLLLELQPTKKYEKAVDVASKRSELDNELSKFRFFPDLYPRNTDGWTIQWEISARRRSSLTRSDTNALQIILSLATAGAVNRLRKCRNCSLWMFAKFRHQAFCSTKCQQKHYGKSKAWKLYRRDYMRKHRRDEKLRRDRIQKSLSSVHGRTR